MEQHKTMENIIDELIRRDTVLSDVSSIGINDCVVNMIYHFWACMFPFQYGDAISNDGPAAKQKRELTYAAEALKKSLAFVHEDPEHVNAIAQNMLDEIPGIYTLLLGDIRAGYEGDPAARSTDEVVLSYPAFKAISIYRMAHVLYTLNVPTIPRIMSEYAHALTGIDIHPGATIGSGFFIDHGTGVVIGETTVIGDRVKLYQHVTLGAKSFAVNEDGSLVKGIKRHPNIGSNVVIYAGATILGGDTTIGSGSVIGGNVWLTHSVPENSKVYSNSDSQDG